MQQTDAEHGSTLSVALSFQSSLGNLPSQTTRGQDHLSYRRPPLSTPKASGSTSATSAGIPRPRSSPAIRSGQDFLPNGLPKQRLSQGGCLPLSDTAIAPVLPPRYSHLDSVQLPTMNLFHPDIGNEKNFGMKEPSHSNSNTAINGNLKWNSNPGSGTLTSTIVPSWV